MKYSLPVVIVMVSVSACLAQVATPALMIKIKDRSEPLRLTTVSTVVRIHGHAAETKTTMTFANPHDRALEGDLYFPLPQGSTVSGYALDIKGVMVDGVAIEKIRARQVFESIVRQGVDPGLVEWTKGNNFKTRVFPIPAKGSRTISVSYITAGDDGTAYRLPLNYKARIDDFSLRIEVVRPKGKPKITGGPAGLTFRKGGEGYIADVRLKTVTPKTDLTVALPANDDSAVLVERGPDGDVYFALQDAPPIPEYKSTVATPKHVVIYWDASGSRDAMDHDREIAVMYKCLNSVLPNDRNGGIRGFTVDLVLFSNVAAEPRRFRWANTYVDKLDLHRALLLVQYDGGTQMASITPWPEAAKPDFYMLFTDGLSNFGRENPTGLKAPVYAFCNSAQANHAFLDALASKTGGRYYNLKQMKDDEVAASIGRSVFSFLQASAGEGGAAEMYPARPQPVTGRFTLVGKLTGRTKTARVTLGYGRLGKTDVRRPIDIDGRAAPAGTLLRTLWAQKKLADLLIAPEANREAILHLGKDNGLVTPYTSLIVLESLEQYVEHHIAPPKSLPDMREEYMRRIDTVAAQAKVQHAAKIDAVRKMWGQRILWWAKEFKYPKDFRYQAPRAKNGRVPTTVEQAQENMERAVQSGGGLIGGGGMGASPERRPTPFGPSARPAPTAPAGGIGGGGLRPGPAGSGAAGGDEGLDSSNGDIRNRASRRQNIMGQIDELEAHRANRGRPGIAMKAWDPKTPYLAALKSAKPQAAWGVYMANRAKYGTSPGFFLDCADFFYGKDEIDRALQVLSNIAELELENASMLRVLGQRLVQTRRFDLAVLTFEQVMRLRPDEPQSYRDLALALATRAEEVGSSQMLSLPDGSLEIEDTMLGRSGEPNLPVGAETPVVIELTVEQQAAMKASLANVPKGVKHMTAEVARAIRASVREDYARAIGLLNDVVMKHWPRFPEIEVIALMELNRLIPQAKAFGVKEIPVDKRLIAAMACDVRIVMTWDADNTDIDLHVIEPSGERAFYGHNRTTIGGLVSKDFTRGYGPEEYVIRKAMHGVYAIEAKYFGSSSAKMLGAVTLRVDIFTDFGREGEQHRSITVRLKDAKEIVKVGKIEF